jgi:uncharacterized protein (TIGR02284 family)
MANTSDNTREPSDKADERLTSALRRLITQSRDSAARYRKSAEDTNDDFLRREFEQIADERDRLVETLTEAAKDLGIEIAKEGEHTANDVHRAFLEFKLKLLGGDVGAIFKEMSRGESALERLFDGVLHGNLPKPVRRKLQNQYRTIQQARDHYRTLARRMGRRQTTAIASRAKRVGTTLRQHPLATVGTIALAAMVLGTVAVLSQEESRGGLDTKRLRGLEKRLRRLEGRGLRQFEKYYPHDLDSRARRGLKKVASRLGSYR